MSGRFSIRVRQHSVGAYSLPRTYIPRASAMLPPHWATAIGKMYVERGHQAEIGTEPNERGEVKLTIRGITQRTLSCHLNDPLGKPGEQDPRDIQATIKKYRPKLRTSYQRRDGAAEEEARWLRGEAGPPPSRRGPRQSSEKKRAAWLEALAEADEIQRNDPGSDPAVIAAWLAAQEEFVRAALARRAAAPPDPDRG